MKRIWIFALLMALALTGCARPNAELPPDWDESWVRVADYVAVEPLDGFELNESNDMLSVSGLYYAAWAAGEGQDFVNADGNEAVVYDAQIYVLLGECRSGAAAEESVSGWIAREKQSYETKETETMTFGGQAFEVLPLVSGSESNPYTHGTAAFGVRNEWAVSVELLCSEGFDGDPQDILGQFLSGFHYAE